MGRSEKQPCVYVLASKRNGTLYIGVTSNLVQRIWQHKNNEVEGFTKKYQVHLLVYYELHETMESAITREKRMKKWNRDWKINFIEKENPEWHDLWSGIVEDRFPPARE
ncbi:MAG: Excinuclease ABC, C subunit-like [Candidatus Rifleibacterium amylolyticum]|nr:MAG: Excinuclease ABC, C subunit-like [Candidatus Rifleibacterium amylolyticum]